MKTAIQIVFGVLFLGLIGVVIWRWQMNGWGSLLWIVMIVLISVIRMPYAKQTKDNVITEKQSVSVEKLLLALVSIGGTFLPLLHLTTGLFAFANYSLPDWAVIIGAVMLIPGGWLFWRSHADLGRNWSVTTELRKDQELVTSGVYQRIRHPMYTAIWILFLAQPLFVHNWIAGLAGPVSFGIMYIIRVPYEEAMMRKQFGDSYDDYCNRSGRLLPALGKG
ncbi:MAG: protein-S-isoprenylcysteine O-methyltransferase [Pseudomonadota bacterium]